MPQRKNLANASHNIVQLLGLSNSLGTVKRMADNREQMQSSRELKRNVQKYANPVADRKKTARRRHFSELFHVRKTGRIIKAAPQ